MKMKSFLKLIVTYICLISIPSNQIYADDSVLENSNKIPSTCNINDEGFPTLEDLEGLNKTILSLPIESTEGNRVIVYKNMAQIAAISLSIYRETGGTIYTYFFNIKQREKTLIEVRNFNFSLPIHEEDFDIDFRLRGGTATETKTKIIICKNYPQNYISNEHLDNIRADAINYLALVHQNL